MTRRFTIGAVAGMLMLVGGCKSASKSSASPGVLRSEPSVLLSLGAGDSLGRRVFLNDLVIAARAENLDLAFTAVFDDSPVDLGE